MQQLINQENVSFEKILKNAFDTISKILNFENIGSVIFHLKQMPGQSKLYKAMKNLYLRFIMSLLILAMG
jgi:hypothetical protein